MMLKCFHDDVIGTHLIMENPHTKAAFLFIGGVVVTALRGTGFSSSMSVPL